MCWGTELSTPPAKRSATKRLCQRLSSDYGKRLCQRLWDAHRLIGVPLEPAQKPNRKPARKCGRNAAGLRAGPFAASGRILCGAAAHPAIGNSAHDVAGRARRAQYA